LITLTDERGLIKSPQSWDEIESLPGYVKGIDPTQHKLKAIIGSYHLKGIHCGLSCNQPHDKGYIAVTQSGAVTNLGHDCGRKYFGVDFITFKNQHHRELDARNNRDLLFTFSLQLDDLEKEINELRKANYGIDWIYKTSQELICRGKGCPDEVIRVVNAMIKSRSNVLKKEREATDAEIKTLELSQNKRIQRPHYVEEDIAIISGLEVLYEENDLRKLTVNELEINIKPFKVLNIENLTHSDLAKWAKWVNSIDNLKERIKNSMNAGLALLKPENLEPLSKIVDKSEDIKGFRKFINSLNS